MTALAITPCPTQLWHGSCWQVRKRALAIEGQSWRGKAHQPDPSQPTAPAAHTRASPRATPWAVVSATSLTTGCTGNLLCKAHGRAETEKQENCLLIRKHLLGLLPAWPRLAVTGWQWCVPRDGCKSSLPTAPGAAPVAAAASSQPGWAAAPFPKQDVVSLMGCAWLAAQQHPWTASKGCKMLCGQGHVRTPRERVLSHLLLPPRSYFVCQSLKETAEFLALASWHAGVKQMAASTEDLPLFHWWRKLCRRATHLSTL